MVVESHALEFLVHLHGLTRKSDSTWCAGAWSVVAHAHVRICAASLPCWAGHANVSQPYASYLLRERQLV